VVDDESNPGKKIVTASHYDPFSIISDYNESVSVMDIVLRSSKGDAYGDNTVNSKFRQKKGALLRLDMQPEYIDGRKRVVNLLVNSLPGEAGATSVVVNVSFKVKNLDNGTVDSYLSLDKFFKALRKIIDGGQDPFLTLRFSEELNLSECRKLAAFFGGIESDKGVRIEPPLKGDLFFKAFVPDDRMRKRENRYIQPLELHLRKLNGKLDGTVVKIDESWGAGNEPILKPKLMPVALHGGLKQAVKDSGVKLRILLIFAEGDIKLGELLDYIKPIRATHDLIHIYIESGWKTSPQKPAKSVE
jgi:hypothetical protein